MLPAAGLGAPAPRKTDSRRWEATELRVCLPSETPSPVLQQPGAGSTDASSVSAHQFIHKPIRTQSQPFSVKGDTHSDADGSNFIKKLRLLRVRSKATRFLIELIYNDYKNESDMMEPGPTPTAHCPPPPWPAAHGAADSSG
ncbi:hypothetical protein F2P81_022084 [Scophthalmus maximus]|uniref:Uncharacterized protein n=1 Tax=Scophthalmus maximus TaxID=52904 RepID=A0A6A4RT64_SCOMX|nr:hypothetical protein F2P81_022084 [Scophthalmus maximus]